MKTKLFVVGCLALSLAACGSDPAKPQPTADVPPPPAPAAEAPKSGGGMFGWLGGGSSSKPDERKGVAVNAYL